jgi:hypothetical protein
MLIRFRAVLKGIVAAQLLVIAVIAMLIRFRAVLKGIALLDVWRGIRATERAVDQPQKVLVQEKHLLHII